MLKINYFSFFIFYFFLFLFSSIFYLLYFLNHYCNHYCIYCIFSVLSSLSKTKQILISICMGKICIKKRIKSFFIMFQSTSYLDFKRCMASVANSCRNNCFRELEFNFHSAIGIFLHFYLINCLLIKRHGSVAKYTHSARPPCVFISEPAVNCESSRLLDLRNSWTDRVLIRRNQ